MADDAFVPCREWLGLEPDDLNSPRKVLGLGADESDPLAIVRAADRRLATLRTVPGTRAGDRDALVATVEAARDVVLAEAIASRARAGGRAPAFSAPPPPAPVGGVRAAATAPPTVVPPPVPPPVPPATAGVEVASSPTEPIRVGRPRVVHRRRSDGVAVGVGLMALVVGAAAAGTYVAWPHLGQATRVARKSDRPQAPKRDAAPAAEPKGPREPARVETTESRADAMAKPRPRPQPRPKPAPSPAPEPMPVDEPAPVREPAPPPVPSPQPAPQPPPVAVPDPEPAPVDVEEVRRTVASAVTKAFAALRDRDVPAAKRELDGVAERALDDQQATDRLQRWRQLAVYAEAYPDYRDKALASAAATAATYDIGGRQIAVVEFTPREFIYRDSRTPGRNLKVPRDAIPPDVERGLVEAWFASDGRAANHLFLGAAALTQREPDLARARKEWAAAADGGERDGGLLLELLEDPAIRGR